MLQGGVTNVTAEELKIVVDKVVETGFDKKYDEEFTTDSEEHEYDEETEVAMPVIKSLVDYETKFGGDRNEPEYVSKKHGDKYEK